MLQLREIKIEDKEWFDGLAVQYGYGTLEYNFTTAFIWRKIFNTKVCQVDGCLVCMSDTKKPSFLYPCGNGDKKSVIDKIISYCADRKIAIVFHSVSEKARKELEDMYPGKFEFTEDRDAGDYIYETQSLMTLSGKKLSAKRNHINRFEENYPDWKYEPITKENIDEVYQMNLKWCEESDCQNDKGLRDEACAVRQAFGHFFDLKLDGGLLRAGGQIVAFSMGDKLNDDIYLVHIEKAFADINGAYPMINKQFVINNASNYKYVDREDDAGVEGLRRAKLSYRPQAVAKKYRTRYIGD